jgi:transcription elongation factor Elf1
MPVASVSCPNCGAPVAVSCNATGSGSHVDHAHCRRCGHLVKVRYANDSFDFRIYDVD